MMASHPLMYLFNDVNDVNLGLYMGVVLKPMQGF